MTTPSVLVPKTELEKLETAIADRKCFRAADGFYDPVFDAARAYLASQRMIATAKEDISDTSSADDRTQPDLSSSDRTLIAAKEETPKPVIINQTKEWWLAGALLEDGCEIGVYSKPRTLRAAFEEWDDPVTDQRSHLVFGIIFKPHIETIRAALSQSKDGWQDISTAPKDSRPIICLRSGNKVQGNCWRDGIGLFHDPHGSTIHDVKAWQPFPAAPVEGE